MNRYFFVVNRNIFLFLVNIIPNTRTYKKRA